jgi:hypothetical protein
MIKRPEAQSDLSAHAKGPEGSSGLGYNIRRGGRTHTCGEIFMRRGLLWIYGFLVGGLIGAGLALLWAPCSGPELRERIRSRWQQVVEEGRQAAAQRRAELERELAVLIRRAPPEP